MRFALVLGTLATATADTKKVRVYFGSASEGIFSSILDRGTGQLTEARQVAETTRSGFVALHPDGTHLYSIGKPTGGSGPLSGSVCAFKIDPATGNLEFLNTQPTQSIGPCYLAVDPKGRNVLVAHYQGGSCAALPLAADGSLNPVSSFHQHKGSSVDPVRQTQARAHCIVLDPPGRYAFVSDLGLDQVLVYKFDSAAGILTPNDPPFAAVKPGGGPRHFAFHPSGKFGYTNLELTSEVTAFRYDAEYGTLTEFQTLSTLPDDFTGMNANAGIGVTPDGRFLYVSNRGHNSIAQFSIDPDSGALSPIGYASTPSVVPQAINLDPTGSTLIVTDKNSGDVSVFRIDPKTGQLAPTGCTINVPKAGSIAFRPLD
jgi:6-phosphogluconolactonase